VSCSYQPPMFIDICQRQEIARAPHIAVRQSVSCEDGLW